MIQSLGGNREQRLGPLGGLMGGSRDQPDHFRNGRCQAAAVALDGDADEQLAGGGRQDLALPDAEGVAIGLARGQAAERCGAGKRVGRTQVGQQRRRGGHRAAGIDGGRPRFVGCDRGQQSVSGERIVAEPPGFAGGGRAYRRQVAPCIVTVEQRFAAGRNDSRHSALAVADDLYLFAAGRHDPAVADEHGVASQIRQGDDAQVRVQAVPRAVGRGEHEIFAGEEGAAGIVGPAGRVLEVRAAAPHQPQVVGVERPAESVPDQRLPSWRVVDQSLLHLPLRFELEPDLPIVGRPQVDPRAFAIGRIQALRLVARPRRIVSQVHLAMQQPPAITQLARHVAARRIVAAGDLHGHTADHHQEVGFRHHEGPLLGTVDFDHRFGPRQAASDVAGCQAELIESVGQVLHVQCGQRAVLDRHVAHRQHAVRGLVQPPDLQQPGVQVDISDRSQHQAPDKCRPGCTGCQEHLRRIAVVRIADPQDVGCHPDQTIGIDRGRFDVVLARSRGDDLRAALGIQDQRHTVEGG